VKKKFLGGKNYCGGSKMTILRNKLVAKILSVLIAFALWAYVVITEDPIAPRTITGVPIELTNVERLTDFNLVLFDVERETVDVTVVGSSSLLARYGHQVTVRANVNVGYAGDHYITFGVTVEDPRLTVEGARPTGMWITVENLVSREMPIYVDFVGDEIPNTEPGNITRHPETIHIRGAQPLINSIAYVEVEIQANQIGRTMTSFFPQIVVLDENRNPIPDLALSPNFAHVSVMLYDVREIPIAFDIVGAPSAIHEIISRDFPSTIRLRGTSADFAEVGIIRAEPVDISDVVRSTSLPISFTMPEGLAFAEGQGIPQLHLEIETMANTIFEFDASEIEILGLDEGFSAQIEEMTILLIVGGDEEVINYLEKEDFLLSLNLQGLEAGTHTVTIVVTHDQELQASEIVPGEIYITISY
jgi:YbbR domain-containing protein